MCKIAVLMAEGFEEGETVTIIDILRRTGLTCDGIGFDDLRIKGMHGMWVLADKLFKEGIENYDMLVLPGGRPGGENLRNNPLMLLKSSKSLMNKENILLQCVLEQQFWKKLK